MEQRCHHLYWQWNRFLRERYSRCHNHSVTEEKINYFSSTGSSSGRVASSGRPGGPNQVAGWSCSSGEHRQPHATHPDRWNTPTSEVRVNRAAIICRIQQGPYADIQQKPFQPLDSWHCSPGKALPSITALAALVNRWVILLTSLSSNSPCYGCFLFNYFLASHKNVRAASRGVNIKGRAASGVVYIGTTRIAGNQAEASPLKAQLQAWIRSKKTFFFLWSMSLLWWIIMNPCERDKALSSGFLYSCWPWLSPSWNPSESCSWDVP